MITMTTTGLRAAVAVAAAAAVLPVGVALAHDGSHDGSHTGLTRAQRQVIVESTRRFRDVDRAVAAGYVPTDVCVALPDGSAGMGMHYVNPAYVEDGRIDPTMPEILVYHHDRQGRLRLGAIEYLAVDADQDLATDADRPTLMGHAFDGPMEGHEPGMPVHYDLHAWVFTDNPAGELAAFNPSVSCD
jgi:hypothetical protein